MSLAAIEESLRTGVQPLYLLLGEERALLQRAVELIEQAVLPQVGIAAFNHTRARAHEDCSAALTAARTLPMMSKRRLVLVLDVEQAPSSLLESLAEYASDPATTTTLVVAGTGFPSVRKGQKDWGGRLRNAAKKHGFYLKFSGGGGHQSTRWALDHARRIGSTLGPREAEMLVELVGTDLATLEREVEKAALHASGEAITQADLHAVCSLVAEAVIWDLTSAIVRRDADQALATLHRLLEDGEAAHRLLAMIAWQLRQLLEVAALARRGADEREIRQQVRMNQRTLTQVLAAVRQQPPAAAEIFAALAGANAAMNRSRAGDRRVLEAFVLELCAG